MTSWDESRFWKNPEGFRGELRWNEPLSKHTYYRIGGPARLLAIPTSVSDLQWLAQGIENSGVRFLVLGLGSNVLASDEGFAGLVIRLHRLNLKIEPQFQKDDPGLGATEILTGASVANSTLLRRAAQEGWGGLEFLSGVPGSVGGAVVMNAGTHLGEAQSRIRKVVAYRLGEFQSEPEVYVGDQLRFEYRSHRFLPVDSVVYSVVWEVQRDEPALVQQRIDEMLRRRKSTQPVDYPSCGSVFKNPKESGLSAWQVVDRLGLRGHQIGQAQFSPKHSNFIINLGGAQAKDVRALIELAKMRAQTELGITLQQEVIYI
ncbi:MAG: UDP-N-acetylmuramate dehydrogenase [Bdellovibrionia bacterium]